MLRAKIKAFALITVSLVLCASVPVSASYTYEDAADEFRETLEIIDTLYYYSDELDYKLLLDKALKTVFDNLDQYSDYLTINEYNDFQQYAETNKSGIGIILRKTGNGYGKILKVFKDSPAEKAGLLVGDLITKVGSYNIVEKKVSEIRDILIGDIGTNIALTVLRDGKVKEITAKRGTYVAPLAERADISKLLDGADAKKAAYIEISSFAHNEKNPQNDTAKQFLKIYNELKKEGIKNLIIDLRGNSGGDVLALIDIAEVLANKGNLFTFKYSDKESETFKSVKPGPPDFNIAVLVDEGTASSAEILASVVKESGAGIVVGSRTFGKGVGQVSVPAADGKHMLHLTVTEIISRNGNRINGVGITPDILIESPPWIMVDGEISEKSSEETISALRKTLAYIGYDAGTGKAYDDKMKNAVKNFQKEIDHAQDGVCSAYIIGRINDFVSDKAGLNDTALKRAYDELNKR